MKKYTQESKLSLGNWKNSSKQTGVLDLKPTGIVHSIGYKQVQIGQKEHLFVLNYFLSFPMKV